MGAPGVAKPSVAKAMRKIRRRDFLPAGQAWWARRDHPLPIGHGQTNSQPSTVATMLALLDVHKGQRVLDVGAGSGWTTALLASLVEQTGEVFGVELEPDLVAFGSANLERRDMPWAGIRLARKGVLGWPELAPYDRILVSANARTMPAELVDQLGPDGVMVLVVDSVMVRLVRDGDSAPTQTAHGAYRFVPLR